MRSARSARSCAARRATCTARPSTATRGRSRSRSPTPACCSTRRSRHLRPDLASRLPAAARAARGAASGARRARRTWPSACGRSRGAGAAWWRYCWRSARSWRAVAARRARPGCGGGGRGRRGGRAAGGRSRACRARRPPARRRAVLDDWLDPLAVWSGRCAAPGWWSRSRRRRSCAPCSVRCCGAPARGPRPPDRPCAARPPRRRCDRARRAARSPTR